MKNPPANLKFSPVAVVPQANRRGRIILNLSFPIRSKTTNPRRAGKIVQPSVNESTIQTAPSTPVKLIGVVLFEMFEYMAAAPPNVDILLSKVDLSDGFWRMTVHAHDCYNFCYILPHHLSPLGWSFCRCRWGGKKVRLTFVPQPRQVMT